MGKQVVYICDTPDCRAVLIDPAAGYVVVGVIKATLVDGEKYFVKSPGVDSINAAPEVVYCKECFAKLLGLHV